MKTRPSSFLVIATILSLAACDQNAPMSQSTVSPAETSAAPSPLQAASSATAIVPTSGPALIASPNPVPAGAGSAGASTIAWNTGGALGEIYLSMNGAGEKLFARGVKGSQVAPWIAAGTSYEFRLCDAADHSKVINRVVVTRTGPPPASGAEAQTATP